MSSATSVTPKLRYRLTIEFEGGGLLCQTKEDKSIKDSTKSFWYDVITDPRKVINLFLCDGRDEYSVNFIGGEFAINDVKFRAEPLSSPLPPGGVFQPLYFRDNSVKITQEGIQSHTHKYRIGWKYTVMEPYIVGNIEGALGRAEKEFIQTIVID